MHPDIIEGCDIVKQYLYRDSKGGENMILQSYGFVEAGNWQPGNDEDKIEAMTCPPKSSPVLMLNSLKKVPFLL